MKFSTLIILIAVFTAPLDAEEKAGGATPVTGASEPSTAADDETVLAQEKAKEEETPSELDFITRANFVLAKLMKNSRSMDPFGQQMDPANTKEAPMLAEQYDDIEETPTLNNSSLKSALLTLPITGIYPQRSVIVIGARSFTPGGEFGMKLQELTIRLRFEGVRGKEIFFKDMETQEVTSIEYNPQPQGFEPLINSGPQPAGAGIVSMKELFIVN
jgi:hypothetical protein